MSQIDDATCRAEFEAWTAQNWRLGQRQSPWDVAWEAWQAARRASPGPEVADAIATTQELPPIVAYIYEHVDGRRVSVGTRIVAEGWEKDNPDWRRVGAHYAPVENADSYCYVKHLPTLCSDCPARWCGERAAAFPTEVAAAIELTDREITDELRALLGEPLLIMTVTERALARHFYALGAAASRAPGPPREPTQAMMRAGVDASLTFKTLAPMYSTEIATLWRAMYDAAEAAPGREPNDGWNLKNCRAVKFSVSAYQCVLNPGHEERHCTRFGDSFDAAEAAPGVTP